MCDNLHCIEYHKKLDLVVQDLFAYIKSTKSKRDKFCGFGKKINVRYVWHKIILCTYNDIDSFKTIAAEVVLIGTLQAKYIPIHYTILLWYRYFRSFHRINQCG